MSLVVDASMTVAWFFTVEHAEAPRAILPRVALEGAIVPSLWKLKVANVLRNTVRSRKCTVAYADHCLARLSRLQIAVDSETDARAWGHTRKLSLAHDLTVCDAAYLELAIRRKNALASCDTDLLDAGRREGIAVLAG